MSRRRGTGATAHRMGLGELARDVLTTAGAPFVELVDDVHQELVDGHSEPEASNPSRSMLAAVLGLGALTLGDRR